MNKIIKLFFTKYLALFLLTVIMAISTSACSQKPEQSTLKTIQERQKIIAGVKFDSKPFGFIDSDKQLKGFDVDLIKEIAKRLLGDENAVEFKQVTASNRIFSLTSGATDMVAATMTINEKRKQILDFSNPYYVAGQAIMVSKNSKIKSIKDLNGKRVVVVLGSTSEGNIRLLAPGAIIKGFRTYTDAFSALKANRADALTTDDSIIYGFLHEDPSFKMLQGRYTKEPYGIGFRKGKASESLQEAVNEILDSMIADGTLARIQSKWLKES